MGKFFTTFYHFLPFFTFFYLFLPFFYHFLPFFFYFLPFFTTFYHSFTHFYHIFTIFYHIFTIFLPFFYHFFTIFLPYFYHIFTNFWALFSVCFVVRCSLRRLRVFFLAILRLCARFLATIFYDFVPSAAVSSRFRRAIFTIFYHIFTIILPYLSPP